MKKIKPSLPQIIFSLTFLYCLLLLKNGLTAFLMYYSFFLWIWIAFIARKTTSHKLSNNYGRKITKMSIIFSIITFLLTLLTLFLSISLLFRMVFAINHIYIIVFTIAGFIFLFFFVTNFFVAVKNLKKINPEFNVKKTLIQLIIYPLGLWTTLEALKQS